MRRSTKKMLYLLLLLSLIFIIANQFYGLNGAMVLDMLSFKEQKSTMLVGDTFKLASFNIQILGKSKVSKSLVEEVIPKIIGKYDVIAIQELRDSSEETINTLKQWLPEYNFVVSERLGRSVSKEQYIVAYKRGKEINSAIFPDNKDVFEREPQITYLEVGNLTFSFINVHIKPEDAENEIKALEQVITYAIEKNKDPDFVLVGDFNSDCSYYNEDLNYLKEYNWVIDNKQDTTLGKESCTYDRIITNLKSNNFGVDNFKQEFSLSDNDAETISDHYPVWVELGSG